MRAVDHYTFLGTIKIPPDEVWNKYKILKISLLSPYLEYTEGLNHSIIKVLCLPTL